MGSADLAPHLSTFGTPNLLTTLQYGDAWFEGYGPNGPAAFGIERKRLQDALACMHDSRLASVQLPGMLQTYEYNYVIMEGVFKCDDDTGVMMTYGRGGWYPVRVKGQPYMYRDWDNWTTSLAMIYGVVIKYTSSPKGTARALTHMYHHFQKHWSEHKTGKVIYTAPPPPWASGGGDHVVLRVASQFDGIGWELSRELAVKYGTVRGLLGMDSKGLQEIHGIGKVKAAKVLTDLDRRFT